MGTKAATTTANKKQAILPYCLQCKKRFRAKTKTKKYCTDECRLASVNAKKRVTSKKKASANPFFYWLASEVSRAGTLQILQGHTKESLLQLVSLYKLSQKYNGYGERAEIGLAPYELSHILPVKHPTLLGLLRADNLVISPKAYNRAHGTKYYGHGVGISRLDLNPKHSISKDAARSTVVQKIISFLGASLVDEVVREAKLQPSKRHQLTEWLKANLNPSIKEHKAHIKALDDMSTIAMSKLKTQLQGKVEEEEGEEASFTLRLACAYTDTQVLMAEWKRLASYRTDILPAYDHLDLMQRMTGYKFQVSFDAQSLQLVFDMLHGREISHVYPALESQHSLANSKGHKLHAYVIPGATVVEQSTGATEAPTATVTPLKAPVRLSSSFKDFAEEADWEMEQALLETIIEPPTAPLVQEDEEEEWEWECVYTNEVQYQIAA